MTVLNTEVLHNR